MYARCPWWRLLHNTATFKKKGVWGPWPQRVQGRALALLSVPTQYNRPLSVGVNSGVGEAVAAVFEVAGEAPGELGVGVDGDQDVIPAGLGGGFPVVLEGAAGGDDLGDLFAAEKKCGHLGGKVLVPTSQHIRTLNAARLASDVEGVSTILLCRTDSHAAQLLTTDVDERDRPFLTGERTSEGFFRIKQGIGVDYAIARSLAYAPYADLLWWETSEPNLAEAERFANEIAKKFPGKMLAYNCSPSFNWKKKLSPEKIATFQKAIGAMGYKFQFVTLAGFHSLNYSMFKLANGYKDRGMAAYSELQEAEFAAEVEGYTATRHQREVGTGWFDAVATTASGGQSSTTALAGSTEAEQFYEAH